MRRIFVLFVFHFFIFNVGATAVASEDCSCNVVACAPCEESAGLDFYTQKCDGGAGLKSCAKPICKFKVPAAPGCTAPVAAQPSEPSGMTLDRKPASESIEFARAEYVSGKVFVERKGRHLELGENEDLFVGDIVETDSASEARLKTHFGDTIHVQHSTKMTLTSARAEKAAAVIQLLRGKIRSQVIKAKASDESVFQIQTRSAVAGVRGTDFVTSYQNAPQEQTTVQTLEGDVVLYGRTQPAKQTHIRNSEYASYVVDQKASNADTDEFVIQGTLAPARQMTAAAALELADASWVGPRKGQRTVAGKQKNVELCRAPAGNMNDCSWTCINNPAKEKTCRTDRGDVQCVRKRCNANGEWTEETRLPASFRDFCNPAQPRVAPCDY